MDSESRAFELPLESSLLPHAGTPLPCPRPMRPQSLAPVAPARLLLSLITALLPSPARAPALIKRRRA